ncbi:hypothetical protein [Rhizobium binae]|uniref:hypothetical protein n=1 Tax=Rhizobium binae TaxID=1138190 RepID=UPI001C82F713|nr:hypothetical protein [Rhizobium binae]
MKLITCCSFKGGAGKTTALRRAHSPLVPSCVFRRPDQSFQRFRRNIRIDLQNAAAFAADLNARRLCRPFCRDLFCCRGLIGLLSTSGPISAAGNSVTPDRST